MYTELESDVPKINILLILISSIYCVVRELGDNARLCDVSVYLYGVIELNDEFVYFVG